MQKSGHTMRKSVTRRNFLKGALAGGAGLLFLRDSRLAFGFEANEKLSIAIIGCGGRGESNLGLVSGENIVALCDTNDGVTAKAARRFPQAKVYADFRRMLDDMHKQIDAVVVSTPDHTHAVASMMAMEMGKHVYCEKPLAHSIYEARMMRDTARKHKVATQMGNQGTARNGFRESVEVVRSGAIGDIFEVHVWSNRPTWPQGVDRPRETPPTPDNLHWDLWLGPAPKRPYSPAYEPFAWRGWKDFGTGALGDMGCHTLNLPFMSLDLGSPSYIEAEVHEITAETYPKSSIITYLFPARGNLRSLRLKWYDGGLKPADDLLYSMYPRKSGLKPGQGLPYGMRAPESGALIRGTKGLMYSTDDYGSGYELLPKEDFVDFKKPEPTMPRSPGHHEEWIRACKGGEPTMCNFGYGAALTEMLLLGNLAILTGEPITWDSQNMRAVNCPKADEYISRPYRKGWKL